MQCEALEHAPLICEGFGGLKGDKVDGLRVCHAVASLRSKFKSTCLPFE